MTEYHVIAVPTALDGEDHSKIIGKASSEDEAKALCAEQGYTVIEEPMGNADTFTADDAPALFGYVPDGLGAIAITVEP